MPMKMRSRPPTKSSTTPKVPALAAPQAEHPIVDRKGSPALVVGIGASAGGLDALRSVLTNLSNINDLAIVIIQHSGGQSNALLIDILSRATHARVTRIVHGAQLESSSVYVAPPHTNVALSRGFFELQHCGPTHGMPIDTFFQSLASDRREQCAGMVLSGTGSDGTLGLQAIREYGGATLAQEPSTAEFGDMPRSAIQAGCVETVGTGEQLAARVMAYGSFMSQQGSSQAGKDPESSEPGSMERILACLRERTGNDFSQYKASTLQRRIHRRMNIKQVASLADYEKKIMQDPLEADVLFRELLIGVTRFFRNPAAWKVLEETALPALFASRQQGGLIRAWVAGCSTGEEAYSLAIAFKEAASRVQSVRRPGLQIFATDLDGMAIDRARAGIYPTTIASDVPAELLDRYFVRENEQYRIGPDIREMIVFAPQNIAKHPPFTKVDILTCRNLLIYLSLELQNRILSLFHFALTPGGILFLGSAESTGSAARLFDPLDGSARLYRSTAPAANQKNLLDFIGNSNSLRSLDTPKHPPPAAGPSRVNLQPLVDHAVIQRLPWSGVLCSDDGDVLYISGSVGDFLEPPVGRPNVNVLDMAREGLRHPLSKALRDVRRTAASAQLSGLRVGTGARVIFADIRVERLTAPAALERTILILLTHAAEPVARRKTSAAKKPQAIEALKADVLRLQAELEGTREAVQASEEELRSSNEEMQSANEELQSMNEELMTSKEELQSLNEELQVVNQELQAKNEDLSRFSNDMKNLLNSTDIATLFLDSKLCLRRFTTSTSEIMQLIPGDLGRPITDIACDLDYPMLKQDALQVLSTLVSKETQASTPDDRHYVVRIMPYRTLDNVIDGVVITFVKTRHPAHAQELSSPAIDRRILDLFPNPMWTCTSDGICDFTNRAWRQTTGKPERADERFSWLSLVHVDDKVSVTELWQAAVQTGDPLKTSFRFRGADGSYLWCYCNLVAIKETPAESVWYGSCTDVSALMEGAQAAEVNVGEQILALLEDSRDPVIFLNSALHVHGANRAADALFPVTRQQARFEPIENVLPAARDSRFLEKLRAMRKEYSCFSEEYATSSTTYLVRVLTCGVPLGGVVLLFQSKTGDQGA